MNQLNVIHIHNPLDPRDHSREVVTFEPGKSLSELFPQPAVAHPRALSVNGKMVAEDQLDLTFPCAGDYVTICPIPDGDGAKSILRIVAMIALTAVSGGIGGFLQGTLALQGSALAVGSAFWTGAVMVGGTMVINSLLPPPKPKDTAGSSDSPTYGVDGPKNTSAEGVVVPVPYGAFRTAGNVIQNYTVNTGDGTQMLYMLFNAGEGPIASITDIEINDQPLSTYIVKDTSGKITSAPEVITDRLGTSSQLPIPWFADGTKTPITVNQEAIEAWKVITTGEIDRFRIDFAAPSGLFKIDGNGKTVAVEVVVEVQARLKTGVSTWGAWTPVPFVDNTAIVASGTTFFPKGAGFTVPSEITYNQVEVYNSNEGGVFLVGTEPAGPMAGQVYDQATNLVYSDSTRKTIIGHGKQTQQYLNPGLVQMRDAVRNAVRRSALSAPLTEGIYEVRYRRLSAPSTDSATSDKVYVTDLNEIVTDPVAYRNTALLAIKLKLGEQINSMPTVTYLNGGKMIKVYQETTGQFRTMPSDNPAWITYDILTNARYGGGAHTSRVPLTRWREWALWCEQENLTFHGNFDTQSNVWDAANEVARCGRGQIIQTGTRFDIILDRAEPPSMMFSVANMIEGTFKQNWLSASDRANEIEVSYADKDDGYRQRTVRLYDRAALAAGAPQKTAAVKVKGIDNAQRAYEEAQLMLNMNRYILRTVEFSAPIEAIACSVGSVVLVQHDMPQWGTGGRVQGVASNRMLWSEDLRNTTEVGTSRPWSQFDDTSGGVVVTTSTASPPAGTLGYSKIQAGTAGLAQRQVQQFIPGVADGSTILYEVLAKAGECKHLAVYTATKSLQYPSVQFNLETGVVAGTVDVGGAGIVGTIVPTGEPGWWRCTVRANVLAGASNPSIVLQLRAASGQYTPSAIGDGLFVTGVVCVVNTPAVTAYLRTTTTALTGLVLDRPVSMSVGETYQTMVFYPALQQFADTVKSIVGNAVVLNGYNGAEYPQMRFKFGGIDRNIEQVVAVGADYGVVLDDVSGISVGNAVELWEVNALVYRPVVNPVTSGIEDFTIISLSTPLPSTPVQFDKFLFGRTNKVAKPFRVKRISGTHEYRRDLACIEYNEAIYDVSGADVPDIDYSDLTTRLVEPVTITGITENVEEIGGAWMVRVTVTYSSAQSSYLTSEVQVKRQGLGWETAGINPERVSALATRGEPLTFRVIARDRTGRTCAIGRCPEQPYTTLGDPAAPGVPLGFTLTFGTGGILANWFEPAELDWIGNKIKVGPVVGSATEVFNGKGTQVELPWRAAGVLTAWLYTERAGGVLSTTPAMATLTVSGPANVTVTSSDLGNGITQLRWTNARTSQPIKRYTIRVGTTAQTFASLTDVATVGPDTLQEQLTFASNATRRVWVRAEDMGGNFNTATFVDVVTTSVLPPSTNYATVAMYQWSTAQPDAPVAGQTSTYTWATGAHTGYGGGGGWAITIGANPGSPGIYLWKIEKPISAATTVTNSTVSWNTGASISAISLNGPQGPDGISGDPGIRYASPAIYRWAASIPTVSGSNQFVWATAAISGALPVNWFSVPGPPPSPGFTLWKATANLIDSVGVTQSAIDWSQAPISAAGYAGTSGTSGTSVYTGTIYRQAASVTTPSGGQFDFSTAVLTAPINWSVSQPATTTTPTWACEFTFVTTTAGAVVGAGTWGTPYIDAVAGQNGGAGAAGESHFVGEIYNIASSLPATPTGGSYNFATGVLTPPASWSSTMPPSSSAQPTYRCTCLFKTLTTGVPVAATSWSAPVVVAQNGAEGPVGSQGASARIAYAKTTLTSLTGPDVTTSGGASFPPNGSWGASGWSGSSPAIVAGESVYQTNGIYNPASGQTIWGTPYLSNLKVGSLSAISANLGAITAGSMNINSKFLVGPDGYLTAKGIRIEDESGNVIMQTKNGASSPVPASMVTPAANWLNSNQQWSEVGGAGKPENNATLGANADNFTGKIGGDNLVRNGSFDLMEVGNPNHPAGYYPYTSLIPADWIPGSLGRNGSGRSFALRALGSNAGAWAFGVQNDTASIVNSFVQGGWQPGKTYTVAFYARKVNGASWGGMQLNWNQPPASTITSSNPALSSQWQRYVFRITWGAAIEGAGRLYVSVAGASATIVNDEIYIDDLMVIEGDVVPEWYESSGDSVGLTRPITPENASTYIANAAIDLAKIKVASIGSLSALTATIGTLRTATSGGRMELKDNVLIVYDESNQVRVKLGNLTLS